jgi:hypothetical protein
MKYTTIKADLEKDKKNILRFWKENHEGTLDNE